MARLQCFVWGLERAAGVIPHRWRADEEASNDHHGSCTCRGTISIFRRVENSSPRGAFSSRTNDALPGPVLYLHVEAASVIGRWTLFPTSSAGYGAERQLARPSSLPNQQILRAQ
eukprot:scaffold4516_cov417-Prasinococcus_capsulatus_cf.AAC.14